MVGTVGKEKKTTLGSQSLKSPVKDSETMTIKGRLENRTHFIENDQMEKSVNPFKFGSANILNEEDLMMIFSCPQIAASDLLNFRLVCRKWRNASTTVLHKKNACRILLTPSVVVQGYRQRSIREKLIFMKGRNAETINNEHRFQDLLYLIRNSPKFPCLDFKFKYNFLNGSFSQNVFSISMLNKEVSQLFSLYGHKIKSVSLHGYFSLPELRKILLVKAPNLECLEIGVCYNGERSRKTSEPEEMLFPKSLCSIPVNLQLKTLRLPSIIDELAYYPFEVNNWDMKIVVELLQAAKKLESIENVCTVYLDLIVKEGKGHLVKHAEFFADENDCELLKVFANSNPQLSKFCLTIDNGIHNWDILLRSYIPSINKILEASKETLEVMHVFVNPSVIAYLNQRLILPFMKNVKYLRLTSLASDDGDLDESLISKCCIFSAASSLAQNFSNLHTVSLNISNQYKSRNPLNFFFPKNINRKTGRRIQGVKPCRTVKVLKISYIHFSTFRTAHYLARAFPFVTNLKLSCAGFEKMNNFAWLVSPLARSVELEILEGAAEKQYRALSKEFAAMVDSIFTGFPVDLCKRLEQTGTFPVAVQDKPETINFFRTQPSICDLKHLAELKISFLCPAMLFPFATKVTGMYAFQQMPNLVVHCSHYRTSQFSETSLGIPYFLAPLAPYVSFFDVSRGRSK